MRPFTKWDEVNSIGYKIERALAWMALAASIAVLLFIVVKAVVEVQPTEVGCTEELISAAALPPVGLNTVRAEISQDVPNCRDVAPPLKAGWKPIDAPRAGS